MNKTWLIAGRLRLAVPAAVAAAVMLAGAVGPAAAAVHREAAGREPLKGPATTVALASNCGVAYGHGNMYIADGLAVRKVSPTTDYLTTPSDHEYTCGVALDKPGNIVFANSSNFTIQVYAEKTGTFYGKPMTAGHLYTVAGDGHEGLSTSGSVATKADLGMPYDVTIDGHGNLVFTDSGFKGSGTRYGSLVQVVAEQSGTFYGRAMTSGHLYTVAGYTKGTGDSGEGGPATKAALGWYLGGLSLDKSGNIVFASVRNQRILVVAEKTGMFYGQAMTANDIYSVAGNGTYGYAGDGGPATGAEFADPWGVTADASGNLIVSDFFNNRVRVVAGSDGTFYGQPMTTGDVYTIIGTGTGGASPNGTPAASAEIDWPGAVAVDPSGGLIVNDYGNQWDRYVPATSGMFYGMPMTAGSIYTIAGNGQYQQ